VVPVIVGPTAAGKSALAMALAEALGTVEIVSADSRQIYIGMDIGTAKPTPAERSAVKHHMLDIVPPDVAYSAGQYAHAARAVIADVIGRGGIPLVVGGSGFYIRALFEGLAAPEVDADVLRTLEERAGREGYQSLVDELAAVDPAAAAAHSANNRVKTLRALACYQQTGIRYSDFAGSGELGRFEHEPRYLGVTPDRETLYGWINARTEAMVAAGLVDETRWLLSKGLDRSAPGLRTVGYKEAIAHIAGEIDEVAMTAAIQQSTRRYAKRQMTWFRRVEGVQWLDPRTATVADARAALGL
jgi:tRNA dimethylallyltransferase